MKLNQSNGTGWKGKEQRPGMESKGMEERQKGGTMI
jgi:hypothetical protein